MVMYVRDEEDVLEANLRAHLALGVDQFLIIDHKSADGTPEILERYGAPASSRRAATTPSASSTWRASGGRASLAGPPPTTVPIG